jgi:rare lipoprotein A
LSRPNIPVRAVRGCLAALALGPLAALVFVSPAAGATLLQSSGAPFGTLERARLSFRRVQASLNVLEGRSASVTGKLVPARAGHLVELQRRSGRGWRTVAHSFTGSRGRFRLRYAPRQLSAQALRVLFPGDSAAAASARRVGLLSVFRLAGASWYGGGGSLACGGWLTGSTLGVANKTLPCGTLVTLRYGARSIRVPVIDRGPYVAGREFDLTEAAKRALGFEGVGEVWSSR